MALVVKNLCVKAGDLRDVGSTPGWGRSPGGGHGNPYRCSCLENPMDRVAWQAIIHSVNREWDTTEQLNNKNDLGRQHRLGLLKHNSSEGSTEGKQLTARN